MLNPIERKKAYLSALSTVYDHVTDQIVANEKMSDEYSIKNLNLSNDPDSIAYNKEQIEKCDIKIKAYDEILEKLRDMSEDIDID